MNNVFIDSNVILYLMDINETKQSIAKNILSLKPSINAQVLAEVANVCKRKFEFTKQDICALWNDLLQDCAYIDTPKSVFIATLKLITRYHFQIFDSLIIASALEAGCKTLYSEDMQHNMIIENRLRIINPFL